MTAVKVALALRVFEWAVVRQSEFGPGVNVCAKALGVTVKDISLAISSWDDPRGHMAVVKVRTYLNAASAYRIEAYYNTSEEG